AARLARTVRGGSMPSDVPPPATIYGAGKVVGRLGPAWSLGALSAVTAENRATVIVDPAMPRVTTPRIAAPTTAFNVLRLKRELGNAGHIGIIGTGSTTFDD